MKLWKKCLVAILKIGLGPIFKKIYFFFQTVLKKTNHFQTEFEKITQARAQEARARDPGPNGVCFQTQFENGPFFFKIVWKQGSFFIFILKIGPGPVFKIVTDPFFKVAPFNKGCTSLVHDIVNTTIVFHECILTCLSSAVLLLLRSPYISMFRNHVVRCDFNMLNLTYNC